MLRGALTGRNPHEDIIGRGGQLEIVKGFIRGLLFDQEVPEIENAATFETVNLFSDFLLFFEVLLLALITGYPLVVLSDQSSEFFVSEEFIFSA